MPPGQPRPGRRPPARAHAVEADVESMEQRLAQLKLLMQEEKQKREAKRLPGGSNWRAGAQDGAGTGARYVDKVLREGGKGGARAQQPRAAPREGSATPLAAAKASHTGRIRQLREESHAQANSNGAVGVADDVPAAAEVGDASAAGQTRDLSELFVWHPDEAIPTEAAAYEVSARRPRARCGSPACAAFLMMTR